MSHPLDKFVFCPVCGSSRFEVNNFKSKHCQDCGFTYYANPCSATAAFIVNDQTLAAIRKLKDANQAYMWQPSYQMGEPDRLLGYPIHTTPFMPTAEAGKTALVFGDYSYYNIGDRGSRSIQELRELFAGNGMIAFVMKERVDGKLVLPEAVQMLKIKGTAGKG